MQSRRQHKREQMISRGLGIVGLGLALLVIAGCARPSSVLVSIDNIPPNAQSLVVLGVHENAANPEPVEPFALPMPPPASSTLLLTLSSGFAGDLQVNLAAFDGPSGTGCLLATGVNQAAMFQGPNDSFRIALQAITPAACPDPNNPSQVVLLKAEPSYGGTNGGLPVTLTGWGFKPGTMVMVGSKPAQATYKSASELVIQTPASAGIGPTPITVMNSNNSADKSTRTEIFRFHADNIVFNTVEIAPGSYPQPGDLVFAKFDPTTTAGFCTNLRSVNRIRCSYYKDGNPVGALPLEVDLGKPPSSLAVGDFNRDGHPDLVVTLDNDNSYRILLNDGNGGFLPQAATIIDPAIVPTMPLTIDAEAVTVGDVDGDGYDDIVIADTGISAMTILRNLRNGSFAPTSIPIAILTPIHVSAADLSNDGRPDIVLVSSVANQLRVFFNDGLGGFTKAGMGAIDLPISRMPASVVLADSNHDNINDILGVSTGGTGSVTILENRLSADVQGYALITGEAPVAMAFADITGDGFEDVIVPSPVMQAISTFRSTDGTGFRGFADEPVPVSFAAPTQIGAVDLDGDGKVDLVVTGTNSIQAMFNRSY